MAGSFPYYARGLGDDNRRSAAAADIQTLSMRNVDDPAHYVPSAGLHEAVNAALILGRPLLVTGEPGTGKTQLAYSIAYEIGKAASLDAGGKPNGAEVPVYKFETKSTSIARDLFYSYDAIAAFREPPDNRKPAKEYVTYQALGRAIIEAYDKSQVAHLLPQDTERYDHPGNARRSVVLIDEIDKAPRDFPNDLLSEIDRMHFRIAEADYLPTPGARSKAPQDFAPNMRPIVIITSNSEKSLPDPFLRRCVFHHIPFPEPDEIENIVNQRFKGVTFPPGLTDDARKLFNELRGNDNGPALDKPPSTAELLDFLQLLQKLAELGERQPNSELFKRYFSALAKNKDDHAKVAEYLEKRKA